MGYLLKESVAQIASLVDDLERVVAGETVVDPTIVRQLLASHGRGEVIAKLSSREVYILGLMAEGRSNGGIAARLYLSPKTVEAHVHSIFTRLGLTRNVEDHRRVLAVLRFLEQVATG